MYSYKMYNISEDRNLHKKCQRISNLKVLCLWEFYERRGFCDKLNKNFPKKSITSWSWSLSYIIISLVTHIVAMRSKGQIIA